MLAALLLLITGTLILANAFFVASEFAIVKVRPTRLEELGRQGNRTAELALRITRKLDAYLSANQLGITLASLALGWIGEPAIADRLEPLLHRLGPAAPATAEAIALAIAFFVITALHTIIGELAPKSIAIQHTERVALATARPLHVFYLVMWPVIWVLNTMANAFVRLLHLPPPHDPEVTHTSEELRMLLVKSPVALDRELRRMLVRIFDFRRRTARHVMSLRSDAATLRSDASIDEAVRVALDAGYSRYPVLDPAGHVVGYVHVRDLFEVLGGRRKAGRVSDIVREPVFVRGSTSVERIRREMQARQIPVAIVVSSNDEFLGIVTIEDLLEEIVGEIRDENDEEVPPIVELGDGRLEIDGRVLLADLAREAGVVLRPEAKQVETLGGYVLARLGRPASPGERVPCDGLALIVTDVAGRRVRRVRLVRGGEKEDTPALVRSTDPGD